MSATVPGDSKYDLQPKICITIIFVCLLSCSCASQVDVLKPSGEQATVTLRDMAKHKVELLVVSDARGSGEPETSFSSPFDEAKVRKLELYVRYPQGLTDQQWNSLLRFHGQRDFASLTILPH
jgi:hypothetical protein